MVKSRRMRWPGRVARMGGGGVKCLKGKDHSDDLGEESIKLGI
jgi:hypothetical protein